MAIPASEASCHGRAPAMKATPTKLARKTSVVPRSGCRYTRYAGGPSRTSPPSSVQSEPMRTRRSANHFASTTITRTLASSLNCTFWPPIETARWAPSDWSPMTRIATSMSTPPTNSRGAPFPSQRKPIHATMAMPARPGRAPRVRLRAVRQEPVVVLERLTFARDAEFGRAGLSGDGQLRVRHPRVAAGDDESLAFAQEPQVLGPDVHPADDLHGLLVDRLPIGSLHLAEEVRPV